MPATCTRAAPVGLFPDPIRGIRDILTHLARNGKTVLVSSHLLAEMSLMADDLVVIGRGTLIEQCSVDEFTERHSTSWTRVSSPQLDTLLGALASSVSRVDRRDATAAALHGIGAAAVGEIAASASVVLHELATERDSLEDAFLRLTADAQEYATAAVPPPPPPTQPPSPHQPPPPTQPPPSPPMAPPGPPIGGPS